MNKVYITAFLILLALAGVYIYKMRLTEGDVVIQRGRGGNSTGGGGFSRSDWYFPTSN
ncbi:hypothetical protein KBC04_03465 [Candidatus Babeliales bacterium]|nr:hypothetical protein [Candidatus Babeliales bacterium]MBP9843889.1 hypothetical protein [Candidatus Babeliales bacterium]